MDETILNFTERLCGLVEDQLGFTKNEKALFLLDAESADKEISDLEEKVEDLEWVEADYYTIDKDDLEAIVSNAMRKMFFSKSATYMPTEEGDYDNWVDDAVHELKEAIEPFTKVGVVV